MELGSLFILFALGAAATLVLINDLEDVSFSFDPIKYFTAGFTEMVTASSIYKNIRGM